MRIDKKSKLYEIELKEDISRLQYLIDNNLLFKWEVPVHQKKISELTLELNQISL
jgi:hypothetical protein